VDHLREHALRYHDIGWHPFPLPAGTKAPPPEGRTGYGGVDLTRTEIEALDWSGNLALRMPPDVIGLDIDCYRGGDVTLHELLAKCGPLPNTWISHSGRNDGSGIRLYRVPRMLWVHALAGIEIIQVSHRYAVVYPSTHPDGRRYGWFDQAEGGRAEGLPVVEDDLPELPWPWIAELSRAAVDEVEGGRSYAVGRTDVERFIAAYDRADQPSYISNILSHFTDHVDAGYSRHDSAVHALLWALENVRAGVAAARPTLDALASLWVRAVAGDTRRAQLHSDHRTTEWEAMVAHAVGKIEAKTEDEIWGIRNAIVGPTMNVPPSPESVAHDESEGDEQPSIFLDWSAFANRDEGERRWLVEGFWPWGRAMALWAGAKTGKSELALWCAAKLALGEHPWTDASVEPVDVVYLDLEMTEDDLDDRLSDFDFDPLALGHLHYALLPPLHALDDEKGGRQIEALVAEVGARAVVIDTFSRTVAGDENVADTAQAFYRHTGSRLKRAGVGYLRLDHAGKDLAKGQRGSSAKRDDVDVVWLMSRAGAGVVLDCSGSSRLSWVGPTLRLDRVELDGVLSYSAPLQMGWPAGTAEKVKELDALGLPLDISRRSARIALATAGIKPGKNQVLGEALRFRRESGHSFKGTIGIPQTSEDSGDHSGTTSLSSPLTWEKDRGPVEGTTGDHFTSPSLCHRRSIGGDQGTSSESQETSADAEEPAPAVHDDIEEAAPAVRDDLDAVWARNEAIGRETGHVVTRCPGCGARALTSILNSSGTSRWTKSGGGWPKCKQCLDAPRVEPLGDVEAVRRLAPGKNPTARQLRARPAGDGFAWRPREDPPDPEEGVNP
jgi:hypothetical protein